MKRNPFEKQQKLTTMYDRMHFEDRRLERLSWLPEDRAYVPVQFDAPVDVDADEEEEPRSNTQSKEVSAWLRSDRPVYW